MHMCIHIQQCLSIICAFPPGRVPRDAGAGEFGRDLVLQGPLAQVHHVRGLVDSHHAVCRTCGQHQAHVLRGKLHIGHRCPTVHKCGSLYLMWVQERHNHWPFKSPKVIFKLCSKQNNWFCAIHLILQNGSKLFPVNVRDFWFVSCYRLK